MREILFRGKRLDNGEWVEGSLYLYGEDVWIDAEYDFPSTDPWVKVDPTTVGQYTGRAAKGKRIFEGDILSGLLIFGMRVAGVVEFRDGSFGVKWMRGTSEEFSAFTSCCNIEWEVIGNIHDNSVEDFDGR